jgi:hypothetical protein
MERVPIRVFLKIRVFNEKIFKKIVIDLFIYSFIKRKFLLKINKFQYQLSTQYAI